MENGEWAAQQNEQLLAINPLLSNSQLSTLNTQLTPLHFQEELERQCWLQGGRRQTAPAQRMLDFTRKKLSYDLPESSYSPGLISSRFISGCRTLSAKGYLSVFSSSGVVVMVSLRMKR